MSSLMRMILVAAALTAISSTNVLASECATCKGSWKAGGGISVIVRKGERYDPGVGYSNWGATFTPNFETFVSNGLAIGAEVVTSYNHAGSKYHYTRQVDYGIIPMLSGYFTLGGSEREYAGSFFYVKFGAGFMSSYVKRKGWYYWPDGYYNTFSSTATTAVAAGQFGVMPMLSRSIGLEVGTLVLYSSTEGRYGLVYQFGAGFSVFAL